MQFLSFVFGLFLGFILGLFILSQMLLPLIYSLPKSIYLYLKGEVKFTAIIVQFIPPLIWFVILVALGFIFEAFVPSLNGFFIYNPGFNLGQYLAIAALLINLLRPSGRADMRADFEEKTYKRFRKVKASV